MIFDLQRFARDPAPDLIKFFVRQNGSDYRCVLKYNDTSASPRLCINKNYSGYADRYYTELKKVAPKPRMAFRYDGKTYYAELQPPSRVVWVPLDSSLTEDKCGNTWTVKGSPTINTAANVSGKAGYVSTGNYLTTKGCALGGQDFTVDFWFNYPDSSATRHIFMWTTSSRNARLKFHGNAIDVAYNGTSTSITTSAGTWSHLAMVYQKSTKKLKVFLNGTLQTTISATLFSSRNAGDGVICLGHNTDSCKCYLAHFRIHDGVALWTANFTPPTAADYYGSGQVVYLPFKDSVTFDDCGNT